MYILLYYRREISLRRFREIEKHVIPNWAVGVYLYFSFFNSGFEF